MRMGPPPNRPTPDSRSPGTPPRKKKSSRSGAVAIDLREALVTASPSRGNRSAALEQIAAVNSFSVAQVMPGDTPAPCALRDQTPCCQVEELPSHPARGRRHSPFRFGMSRIHTDVEAALCTLYCIYRLYRERVARASASVRLDLLDRVLRGHAPQKTEKKTLLATSKQGCWEFSF